MKQKQSLYSSFDLGLASVCILLNYELVELDRSNPKKVRFLFENEKGIEQIAEDYFSGKLKVDALGLFNAQKNLKSRIYSNA